MRKLLFGVVICAHLVVLCKRLPEWDNNQSIWVAAVREEPKDPWALNNAANFTHTEEGFYWLLSITKLDIPHWLPIDEREPYYVGYLSLANTFKANGDVNSYYFIQQLMATKLIDRPMPKVTFVQTK